MPAQQAKHWTWTLNNPTDDEVGLLVALGSELPELVQYLVFSREFGESGTPHLQGYIAFKSKKTLSYVRETISARAHCEVSRGSPQQNKDYVSKENPEGQPAKSPEDIFEFGTLPVGRGHRSDLVEVAAKVRSGVPIREIAESDPANFIRYGTGILRYRMMVRPSREGPPSIWVFWGASGTGKTRRCWDFTDADKIWVHPGDRWFDGYDSFSHPAVLFDDFDGSWFKLDYLLKLLDRYVFQVPIKGGYTWWCPKTVLITSNIEPKLWYRNANEAQQNALMRRLREFGSVVHCG
jgi:hypothetical protein